MKIGLFFGSFNPIHVGHLIVANVMATTTDLEKVWFVVSPQNPFKPNKSLLHEFDRLDMVDKAISDNYLFKSCDIEFAMPKPSYTYDTLSELKKKYPQHTFKLIIGEDNLSQFPKWKNHQLILQEFGLYVYPRPNSLSSALLENENVQLITAPLLDISATFIRQAIKNQTSIKYMLPESVELYIQQKKFYF